MQTALLFPTSGCNPKLDFLDNGKAVAKRAKLNPNDLWLHKFRATFVTRHLRAGVDLRTVQHWMRESPLSVEIRIIGHFLLGN
jgi:integrase/recombinase XerD